MKSRRTFTKEFRAETVALVAQQGMTINRVAKDMGLTWSQVDKWVKQAVADRGDRADVLTTAEKEELRALHITAQNGHRLRFKTGGYYGLKRAAITDKPGVLLKA